MCEVLYRQSRIVVGAMEIPVGEKIFTTVLTLITLGAVAALIHSLIAPESTGGAAEPVAIEQKS